MMDIAVLCLQNNKLFLDILILIAIIAVVNEKRMKNFEKFVVSSITDPFKKNPVDNSQDHVAFHRYLHDSYSNGKIYLRF